MGRLRGVNGGGGGGSSLAQQIVSAGLITSPVLTFTRAQLAGVEATFRQASGVWVTASADIARRHFPSTRGGLLIEPARTNFHPNPRYEPVAAGLPTSGTTQSVDTGVTYTYGAQIAWQGVSGKELRVQATSAVNTQTFPMSFVNAIPAASQTGGVNYVRSRFMRLAAGSLSGFTQAGRARSAGGAATLIAGADVPSDGSMVRQALSGLSASTPAAITMATLFSYSAGAAFDATVFCGWDMAEAGLFATTPVLPPTGSPGPATRGADNATMALSAIGTSGAYSIAFGAIIPILPLASDVFNIFTIHDAGLGLNNFFIAIASSGDVYIQSISGGVPTGATFLATITASNTAVWRFGISCDTSSGSYRVVMLNSAGATVADQTISGVSAAVVNTVTARLGANAFGFEAGGMCFTDVVTYPTTIVGASLPAVAAALPA